METTANPALRADAQRNLTRILAAAREVFAEEGVEASIAQVAERAGVGTATIFRRFPTKDHLLAAVIEHRIEEIAETTRRATESKDPAKGLRQLMARAIEIYIHDRGLCESTGTALFDKPRIHELADEVNAGIEALLARGKDAGAVRTDITAADISMLLFAVASAGLKLEPAAPGAWHRYLDVVLDGLRPEGARPLSRRVLTRAQLDAAWEGCPQRER